MEDKIVYLKVKDHSVSGEEFNLLYNDELDLLETHPRPSEAKLAQYYKSEEYISHTDAKRNTFEKVYQYVRSISIKRKIKLINSFLLESKLLLDIGCGTGDFINAAQQDQWTVQGIEPNDKARAIANEKTRNKVFTIDQLKLFEAESFDVITLWHVLEHVSDLDDLIFSIKRLLKTNGKIIIAVPNYKCFDAKYYKDYWAAFDAPRHLWHFSRTAIKTIFSEKDLEVEKILPLKFDAYYVSLLSEKYKFGWMNIFSAFFIASRSNLKASRSGEYSSLIYVLKNKNYSI